MHTFDDLLALKNDQGISHWFSQINTITSNLGFCRVLFGLARQNHKDCGAALIVDSYPEVWRSQYDSEKYSAIDPVVTHSSLFGTPLIWTNDMYQSPAQLAFREEAHSHGLIYGVSLPMHGARGEFGVFSFCLDAETTVAARSHIFHEISNLVLLKDIALQSAISFAFDSVSKDALKLSEHEIEILRWCSKGKTSWEISAIFSCSEANINFHIGKITRKFGVTSRHAAVLLAIKAGLI